MRLVQACLAAAVCLAATAGFAAGPRLSDEGGFFSAEAKQKAQAKIDEIKRETGKDVLVETFATVPGGSGQAKQAELPDKAEEQHAFFTKLARDRAEKAKVKGAYLLVIKSPARVLFEADKATDKFLDRNKQRDIGSKMFALLRQKKNDEALLTTLDSIQTALPKATPQKSAAAVPHGAAARGPEQRGGGLLGQFGGGSILGWLCIGGGVLLVVWVVIGLVRSFAGGGGGMGGGGMGGGFGGGGGGFFSSLLGGMFGAAAGMWIYDSFLGGGHSSWGSSAQAGPLDSGGNVGDDPGAGDFSGDAGYDSGNDGGGDFGGGDFGGGDFGGGDFGGGDF
jgi:uncharacterized protein